MTLRDEVALIEPVLARAGTPLVLVGHSYGAAVALIAALDRPSRVRALALYEPTLFSVIDGEGPPPNDADGIRNAVAASAAALDAGDLNAAARHFIDYWMGPGSWHKTPEKRQQAIAATAVNVRRWKHDTFARHRPVRQRAGALHRLRDGRRGAQRGRCRSQRCERDVGSRGERRGGQRVGAE